MKGIKSVLYYISETTVGFISLNGALILIFQQEKKASLMFHGRNNSIKILAIV